eukprot:gene102-4506_t
MLAVTASALSSAQKVGLWETCDEGLLDPPRLLHPTQVTIDGSIFLGAVVMNLAIVVAATLICGLIFLLLRSLDDNGDGMLSRDEMPGWMLKLPGFKKREALDLMGI